VTLLASRRAKGLAVAASLLVVLGAVLALRARAVEPPLPTAEVTFGEYVDVVEILGQVRPRKSILITAPMQAGELQILKLAPNGTSVRAGDVVLQFDGSTLQRTIQERESELRQAIEELEQAKAQANITAEQDGTAVLRSRYDVDRAKLGAVLDEDGILPRVETERARLDLADAEQRLVESHVKADANEDASESGFKTQEAKIAKVRVDLDHARRSFEALEVKAPADGVVSLLPNYRASSPMGSAQEFRTGDRAWPGAAILELPDLSSVHFSARLDESDRGRLSEGQEASIRIDAIPDREFQASVTDLSVLARIDFSTWPPVKQFDLLMTFEDPDDRLRPGMTASARIVVGRMPEMHLVPPQSVFIVDGRAVVYRFERRSFVETPVEVVKRSKDQAAVRGAVEAGDRVSLVRPEGT
jgi:RND family efflux transporter MFP subunit